MLSRPLQVREFYNLNQEIEIEFKNLITKEEFNRIRTYLPFPSNGELQTNYYFETNQFTLKKNHSALRIREKNGMYTLTLKQPHKQGLLETHDPLSSEEAKKWMNNHQVSTCNVTKQLDEMNIDVNDLIYYGSLTTVRLECKDGDFIYVLDDSHYNNHSDYELEIEAPSYEAGLEVFNRLLKTLSIPKRETPNKIKRFFDTML